MCSQRRGRECVSGLEGRTSLIPSVPTDHFMPHNPLLCFILCNYSLSLKSEYETALLRPFWQGLPHTHLCSPLCPAQSCPEACYIICLLSSALPAVPQARSPAGMSALPARPSNLLQPILHVEAQVTFSKCKSEGVIPS